VLPSERFPKTREGLEALEAAIAEVGSGAELARQMGVKSQAVSGYRKSLIKFLEAQK
jgi:hypothetical protein